MCILTVSVILMLVIVLGMCFNGNLFGAPETLVFRSSSAKAVYDGTVLVDDGYTLLSGELKKGHRAKVNVTGAQEGVGKSENRIYVTILDSFGADVSGDYKIITECGILEVKPIEISVKTESAYKEYDGEPLTNGEWSITTPEAFMPGDHAEVTVTGAQTDIGSAFNSCTVQVFDQNGKDVSYNYDVNKECGILTVGKINLTVTSYPCTVPFGDIAQTSDYGVDDFKLLPGHKVSEVIISGRQEMPGSSPNTIDSVKIVDEVTGEDVSDYYNVIKSEGALKVEESGFGQGDGNSSIPDDTVVGYVQSSESKVVYLKDQSWGDYIGNDKNGNYWTYAPTYSSTLRGFSADYLTGSAIKSNVNTSYTVSAKWNEGFFALPYYMSITDAKHEYDQSRDTVYGSTQSEYSLRAMTLPEGATFLQNSMEYINFERAYREFVYQNYTDIDNTSTYEYMRRIIEEQGFYGNDIDTILRVAYYIQQSARYNLEFDQALEMEDDIAVAFLDKYKEGVCRHYATSATALYRAMGIPARYTVGYAVYAPANQMMEITAKARHAWVEVYIDGMGWMMVEVTGGSSAARQKEVDLEIKNKWCQYGTEIPAISYSGFEDYEELGYRIEITFNEIPMEYGKHPIRIEDYKVYDSRNRDVSLEFIVKYNDDATMHVYREQIEVSNCKSANLYKYVYDGNAHTVTGSSVYTYRSVTISSMNRTIYFVPTASIVNVGEAPATFAVTVLDADGNNVTDEYRIIPTYATIKVTPRPMEITIHDAKKVYDGKPLTPKGYSSTGLVTGHYIEDISFIGSQTEIGSTEAIIDKVVIKDKQGNNVTENYAISYIPGELKVTR